MTLEERNELAKIVIADETQTIQSQAEMFKSIKESLDEINSSLGAIFTSLEELSSYLIGAVHR